MASEIKSSVVKKKVCLAVLVFIYVATFMVFRYHKTESEILLSAQYHEIDAVDKNIVLFVDNYDWNRRFVAIFYPCIKLDEWVTNASYSSDSIQRQSLINRFVDDVTFPQRNTDQ